MNIQHSSDNIQHYTPPEYAEAIRSVLGAVSLDPCSTLVANKLINAGEFFYDEGLDRHWYGYTVYCNPPGGKNKNRSNQSIWFRKMYSEWKLNNFESGIFMAFNNSILRTDQESYTEFSFCIPRDRIKFWNTKEDLYKQEKKNKLFSAKDHIKKCLQSLEFAYAEGIYLFPSPAPSHDNVIILFHPQNHAKEKKMRWKFKEIFSQFGEVRL